MQTDRNWRAFVRDSLLIERRKVPYLEAIREREVEPEPKSKFKEERFGKVNKCQNQEVPNLDSQTWEENLEETIITATGQNLDKLIHKSPVEISGKNLEDHPYCALGVVTSKMAKEQISYFGSGCLIASDLVLTCAHNIFRKPRNQIFQEISFVPAPMNFNINHGYKVIETYIPQQFKEADYFSPDKVSLGHIYDYAILVLDTRGDNLKQKFGTIGYDFLWEESEQFKDSCEVCIQVIGYPKLKPIIELNSYRGTAFNDKHFLIYLLQTKAGVSGAPVLTFGSGGFTVRAIHQRDVGNIVKTSNESTKGALKLRKEMFKDISQNLLKEVGVQGYDLREKRITGKQMEKIVFEIGIHQKEIQQKQYLALWLWGNQISDQGCLHLGATQWNHLCVFGLGDNRIGDEGCRYLAQGRWPRLLSLHLGWNQIKMDGCIYLSKTKYWNCLKTLDLWQNVVKKKEGNYLFSHLDWDIQWEFVQQ